MLKVFYNYDEIEVQFFHKTFTPYEIEGLIGKCVDDNRRGSLATISLNGKQISQGVAICHPVDNFCRAIGRKRALADAMYALNKEMRTVIWEKYKTRIGF